MTAQSTDETTQLTPAQKQMVASLSEYMENLGPKLVAPCASNSKWLYLAPALVVLLNVLFIAGSVSGFWGTYENFLFSLFLIGFNALWLFFALWLTSTSSRRAYGNFSSPAVIEKYSEQYFSETFVAKQNVADLISYVVTKKVVCAESDVVGDWVVSLMLVACPILVQRLGFELETPFGMDWSTWTYFTLFLTVLTLGLCYRYTMFNRYKRAFFLKERGFLSTSVSTFLFWLVVTSLLVNVLIAIFVSDTVKAEKRLEKICATPISASMLEKGNDSYKTNEVLKNLALSAEANDSLQTWKSTIAAHLKVAKTSDFGPLTVNGTTCLVTGYYSRTLPERVTLAISPEELKKLKAQE